MNSKMMDNDFGQSEVQTDPFAEPVRKAPLYSDNSYDVQTYDIAPSPTRYPALPCIEDSMVQTGIAYNEMIAVVYRLHAAHIKLAEAKAVLETHRAQILRDNDPKELGSNEEKRNATVSLMCELDTREYRRQQAEVMNLEGCVEACRARCRLADMTLRHIELAHADKVLEEGK